MKDSKVFLNVGICLVLCLVTIIEVWTAMSFALGGWALSTSNSYMLVRFVIFFSVINVLPFLVFIKKGIVFRLILSLCVGFIAAFCLYVYLLMGAMV